MCIIILWWLSFIYLFVCEPTQTTTTVAQNRKSRIERKWFLLGQFARNPFKYNKCRLIPRTSRPGVDSSPQTSRPTKYFLQPISYCTFSTKHILAIDYDRVQNPCGVTDLCSKYCWGDYYYIIFTAYELLQRQQRVSALHRGWTLEIAIVHYQTIILRECLIETNTTLHYMIMY